MLPVLMYLSPRDPQKLSVLNRLSSRDFDQMFPQKQRQIWKFGLNPLVNYSR